MTICAVCGNVIRPEKVFIHPRSKETVHFGGCPERVRAFSPMYYNGEVEDNFDLVDSYGPDECNPNEGSKG